MQTALLLGRLVITLPEAAVSPGRTCSASPGRGTVPGPAGTVSPATQNPPHPRGHHPESRPSGYHQHPATCWHLWVSKARGRVTTPMFFVPLFPPGQCPWYLRAMDGASLARAHPWVPTRATRGQGHGEDRLPVQPRGLCRDNEPLAALIRLIGSHSAPEELSGCKCVPAVPG